MKVETNGLKIVLDADEISDFWNIILFAKDLHNERSKKGEGCMSQSELQLANKLIEITEKFN